MKSIFFYSPTKSKLLYRTVILIIFVLLFSIQNANSQLRGEEEAIHLAKKMLNTIGGEKVWREAQSIKVELTGYFAGDEYPWEENFWLDLTTANGRFIIKSETKDEVIAWTPKSGWKMSEGVFAVQDSARHILEMEYWKRQSVVVFHRLAMLDNKTVVKMGDNDFKFDVIDAINNQFIAQFTVNKKGEPIKWSTKIGKHELEHVFGPLKKFENVTLPSWGAMPSGTWRYEHKTIALSNSLPPVSYDPPIMK